MKITKKIVAVKHHERRNGSRCPAYWHISSIRETFGKNDIYDEWFIKGMPKHIKDVLEKSNKDLLDYGSKRGWFEITLNKQLEFDDFGHVYFDDVVELKQIPDRYTKKDLKEAERNSHLY
jgi:hypothetical protein